MKHLIRNALVCTIVGCIASAALGGEAVQIRLKDGSGWRGEISDYVELKILQQGIEVVFQGRMVAAAAYHVTIEGDIAGETRRKTVFKNDILSIRTIQAEEAGAAESDAARPDRPAGAVKEATPDDRTPGVFVLPLKGGVGTEIRYDEIKMIGEEADKYGTGQIIVLLIDTNGGLVLETELIIETIMDIKKRHRVVAWIQKAISAGCATAMVCDEIYMMTEGTAGSVTTIRGLQHVPEEELQEEIAFLVRVAKMAGHSEHIARSMKLKKFLCSYDKDPQTGEVTFYGDLSGEFILSDEEQNLTFTSSNALHCGFSDGTADTEEELAKLLDLPRWHEKSDYGRKITDRWYRTVERANEEIPRLMARLGYWKTSGSAEEQLGAQISIYQDLIKWIDRAPNVTRTRLQDKEFYQRQIAELRKQLADLKKAQRGGRGY
ncbi:MAG: hypothetical protein IH889_01300 [Planctomycetes bacterium]|nr:hypothetical protein [Planctomycetota bacterium]